MRVCKSHKQDKANDVRPLEHTERGATHTRQRGAHQGRQHLGLSIGKSIDRWRHDIVSIREGMCKGERERGT
jgi:hypothetical protein